MFKEGARQLCPPVIWHYLKLSKLYLLRSCRKNRGLGLDIYWTNKMAEELDRWGERSVWNEIRLIAVNLKGKILDIACGTGETIKLLSIFPLIDVYGFDISDFLIQKAIMKGIPGDHLKVCNAVRMDYPNNSFAYSYSIGSLEHIPETDIPTVIAESFRVTLKASFHMVPVSRSGKDEGWLKMRQSYHNNSTDWWLNKFKSKYKTVRIIDSVWEDSFSAGKWFICFKEESL